MSKIIVFGRNEYLPGWEYRDPNETLKQITDFNKHYVPSQNNKINPYDKKPNMKQKARKKSRLDTNHLLSPPKGGSFFAEPKDDKKVKKIVFKSVHAGPTFILLEEISGELWIFGENSNNCLGKLATKKNERLPECVKFSKIISGRIKSFSNSGDHSIIISSEDSIYGWGYNKYSQLNSGSYSYHETMTFFPAKFIRSRNVELYDEFKKEQQL